MRFMIWYFCCLFFAFAFVLAVDTVFLLLFLCHNL